MTKDKTLDILKRPVHPEILKPTHIQRLQDQGKCPGSDIVLQVPPRPTLPRHEKLKKKRGHNLVRNIMKREKVESVAKATMRKTRLRILYDRIPPIPEQLKPPCDECKTAACCRAFAVRITKEEYDSGWCAPFAVKLELEYMKQLKGRILLVTTVTSPVHGVTQEIEYYLEGRVGEACPFLQDDCRCEIYDQRPITCRIYTCIEDQRITQEMRDGTTDIFSSTSDMVHNILKIEDEDA